MKQTIAGRNAARLDAAFRAIANVGCLLCKKRKPYYQVAFIPDNPIPYGGKPNKTRVLGYRLCKKCKRLPDSNERAEEYLRQQYAPLWN